MLHKVSHGVTSSPIACSIEAILVCISKYKISVAAS